MLVSIGASINRVSTDMCIWMCLATIISCHYRIRWPSMYLFPCLVGVYCWHVYKWEYRHDPSWRYGFWTTWVNDPTEHEHFEEHLDVHSELLLHERMTFMQLENMSYRRPVNSIFTKISVLWALRTMMKRIRYRGVGKFLYRKMVVHVLNCIAFTHVFIISEPS